jgi:hypothetical protein
LHNNAGMPVWFPSAVELSDERSASLTDGDAPSTCFRLRLLCVIMNCPMRQADDQYWRGYRRRMAVVVSDIITNNFKEIAGNHEYPPSSWAVNCPKFDPLPL